MNLTEQAKKTAQEKSRVRVKFTGQITTAEASYMEDKRLQEEANKLARHEQRAIDKEIQDDNIDLVRQWNEET